MTDETIILNPVEFTPGLPEIGLNELGLSVGLTGLDYGESSVTVERVRQDISEGITDAHWPPVECTVPILSRPTEDLPVADPLHRIEGWVADVQRRKQGWLKRHFDTDMGVSGDLACFVDSAGLTPPQSWLLAHYGIELDQVMKFTRYPIWFATVEENFAEVKGVGVRDLQEELADLLGTAPGLITVRVKNEGTEDWRGCYVSLECDDFSSAATALPKYEAAKLTPKGGAVISAAAAPEVRAVGAVAAGVGSISPGLPAGTATGDLLVMVAESGGAATSGEATTPLAAAGWIEQASEKKGNTRLTVLSRIAEAANATATNDTGDHQVARIIGIKAGTFDPAAPFNVTAKGTQALTKAVSIPGATTTRDNCLVIACASGNLPDSTTTAEFSAETNASLTGLTERIDNTTAEGDGGAILAATGVMATHGTYPATTATAVTEAERAVISLAVNPIAEVVKCPPLTAGWVTVLESLIGGTEHMTHVGTRRMILRIDDVSTVLEDVRWMLEWKTLGAATWNQTMVASTPLVVSSPVVGAYQLLDMGEARPERPVTGDPRFQWRLKAMSETGSGKQPLIRDVYPMSTEQWTRVSDTSNVSVDGSPVRRPGTVVDSATSGSIAWAGPEEAKLGNPSSPALASMTKGPSVSHYLKATNFGFTIPTGARILGVTAAISRRCQLPSTVVADIAVELVKGGAISGSNRASGTAWPRTFEAQVYGGDADLWGLTFLPADINGATFGVAISVENTGAAGFAEVDLIELAVAYSEGGNENRICFASRSVAFTDTGTRRQHVTDETWGDVPAPEGVLLRAPAPGQAGQDARLLVIPSVGDLNTRADSASVKAALGYGYKPGYLFAREAAS